MKNWEVKYLDDVCELITCGVAARPNYVDEGVPFLSAKNVKDGQIIWSGYNCITEETHKELTKNNKPLKGDLLYTRVGSYGEAAVIEDDYEFSVFVSLTLIKVDKSKLNNYFLKHYLNSEAVKKLAKASISGSGVGNLNVGTVRKFTIPLPPLPEQQRIVSILDEAFAAIAKAKANAEQNLKNAKELFESYLQGVFENGNNDWEVKCLDELGTITSSKRIYKSEYVKDGVPFYRTKEIKELSNGKPITLELFISRDRYEEIKKSFGVPQIGDLLMSAVGTIGEIMVIENEDEFYFKDGNIVWFKDFQRLDTNYLKYALTAFVEKIKSLAIGAAYSALTIEKLNKYEIAFPKTKEEQQTIVRKLDALRAETQKLEAVYQKKIADLEELKKSILQKAFAGELKTEKAVAV
jgi:type I restriction enzyme, S subunit